MHTSGMLVPSDIGPAWEVLLKPGVNHPRDVPSPASDTSLNQTVTGAGAEGQDGGTALGGSQLAAI